jgi:SAM-dependent methyltransferase
LNFEKYNDDYKDLVRNSIAFIGQDLDFFSEFKAKILLSLAEKYLGDISGLKILDVGCGVGITDHYLTDHFLKVYGVDITKSCIKKAAQLNPKADYRSYGGEVLPFSDKSMDVTFAICVLHHIPPAEIEKFIQEMKRVTKKDGLIIIFEHNPFNPLTNYAVNHCELDDDAILLRMGKTKRLISKNAIRLVEKKFILFTPFRGAFFNFLDRILGWLPLGAQYYVAGKK